jgi:hypothetical protein
VLLAALAAAATWGSAAAAGASDDRAATIVATLDGGKPYVEDAEAGGDAALWRTRLTQALADVDLPVPVRVAAWTSIDDQPDTPSLEAAGLRPGIYLLEDDGYLDEADQGVSNALSRQALARLDQSRSVLIEALRLSGRDAATTEPLPLAEAWVWLRLAAAHPPSPVSLARQLADDPAVLVDSQPLDPGVGATDLDPTSPLSLTLIALVVGGFLVVRAALAVRSRRTAVAGGARHAPGARPVPSRAAGVEAAPPPPSEIETLVTDLGVAIAQAPARPGQVDYDRAQACLDAAERYVDRDDVRARVGVQLLVADGRAWLAGHAPAPRCYFNPGHVAVPGESLDQVERGGLTLPCCRACAAAVRTGREPEALVVDDEPYFTRSDVWTVTGYGSLSQDWAEQVYRDALGSGKREA